MANPFHRQLPAYSPLALRALWAATRRQWRGDTAARAELIGLLKREYDADQVLLCDSGTTALQIAIQVVRLEVGGRTPIAIPAYSCYDVATAAVGSGARLLLYDLEPTTLGPDFLSLQRVLAQGARVVVISPLYGMPIDWTAVQECAASYGARLIEDAAQGHGATWNSRPLGTLGELSVLSFGRGKGWTGGRGGALTVRGRERDLDRVRLLPATRRGAAKVWATSLAQNFLGRPAIYGLPASIPWLRLGDTVYRPPSEPAEISAFAAALAALTYDVAAAETEERKWNARKLLEGIANPEHVGSVQCDQRSAPGYLRLPLRLSNGMTGFKASSAAWRRGLAASYPTTLAAVPSVRARLVEADSTYPGAAALERHLVTAPTHSLVTSADRMEVLRLLNTYGRS